MDHIEFEELLTRYLRGETTSVEDKLIDDWYAAIAHTDPELSDKERNVIKLRVQSRLKQHRAKAKEGIIRPDFAPSYSLVFKVAAAISVIAVAVGAFYLTPILKNKAPQLSSWHVIENVSGRDSSISLADGTVVSLKANSSFRYPNAFNADTRVVELINGEGFFNVKRDTLHPFIVLSKNVKTQVLGTSFIVNSNAEGKVVVSVKSGKVLVSTSDNDNKKTSVYLTANQKVDYNPKSNEIIPAIVEKPLVVVPRQELKNYSFSNSPTTDVLKAIEKIYGIEIIFDESKLSNCLVTTYLDSDEDLFERLNIICKTIGATYSVEDLSIIIESKGC